MGALMYLSAEQWTTPKPDVKGEDSQHNMFNNTITCPRIHTLLTCADLQPCRYHLGVNGCLGEKPKRIHTTDGGLAESLAGGTFEAFVCLLKSLQWGL